MMKYYEHRHSYVIQIYYIVDESGMIEIQCTFGRIHTSAVGEDAMANYCKAHACKLLTEIRLGDFLKLFEASWNKRRDLTGAQKGGDAQ